MFAFQHDGPPPQTALPLRQFLKATFPARWISRRGQMIEWPPGTPNLTLLDLHSILTISVTILGVEVSLLSLMIKFGFFFNSVSFLLYLFVFKPHVLHIFEISTKRIMQILNKIG